MRHPGRHYLGFADDFEQRLIGQGARRRGLTETLDLAWAPPGRFSRHELTRIRENHLDRHHPGQLAGGAMLACAASSLPAAAAMLPAGAPGLRAAILATTVGPNLLITGSVATLISQRIARDRGASLTAGRFSAIGVALVPAQLAAATLGLHITGALR
jgi:hypothetical protein